MPKKFARKPKKQKAYRLTRQPKYDGDMKVTFKNVPVTYSNYATLETKFLLIYMLTDCVGSASWVSKYDQYRIDKIVTTFTPIMTQVMTKDIRDTGTVTEATAIPKIVYSVDYDGDELGNIDFVTIRARANSKEKLCTNKFSISITPNRLIPVYRPITNAYKRDRDVKGWIDNGYADTPHYGVIGSIEAASPTNAFTYQVETKYWVSFHGRKG